MKKLHATLVTLCFLLLSAGFAEAQNNVVIITDPVQYNDYIVNQQTAIGQGILDFTTVLSDEHITKEKALDELQKSLNISIKAISDLKKLKRLDPEFGLADNAIVLFEFYKKTMETGYKELVEELFNPQPDMEKLNRIMQSIGDEEKIVDDAFLKAQENFAKHYKISLGENELQKKID